MKILTIASDIMSTTTNFKMFKISWMSFTKLIQKQQNLLYEMIRRVCNQSKNIASISNSWYFHFHVNSQTFFSQFFTSMLSSLRYLQSELMMHEKLNYVKSIFKDYCSILSNCEKITKYWKNRKMHDDKIFEVRMHTNWSTKFSTRFSIVY